MQTSNPFLVLGVTPSLSRRDARVRSLWRLATRRLEGDLAGVDAARRAIDELADPMTALDAMVAFPALCTRGMQLVEESGFQHGLLSAERFEALLRQLGEIESSHINQHASACLRTIDAARMVRASTERPDRIDGYPALTECLERALSELTPAFANSQLQVELKILSRGLADPRITSEEVGVRLREAPQRIASEFAAEAARISTTHRGLACEVVRALLRAAPDSATRETTANQFTSGLLAKVGVVLDRLEARKKTVIEDPGGDHAAVFNDFKLSPLPDLDLLLSCELPRSASAEATLDRAAMLLDSLGYSASRHMEDKSFTKSCIDTASRLAVSATVQTELRLTLESFDVENDRRLLELAVNPVAHLRASIRRGHLKAAERSFTRLQDSATSGLKPLLVRLERQHGEAMSVQILTRAYKAAQRAQWTRALELLVRVEHGFASPELRARAATAAQWISELQSGRLVDQAFGIPTTNW